MKKLISLLTCIALCISIGFSSNASDISDNDVTSSFYNLEEGGLQEFVLTASNGTSVLVQVSENQMRSDSSKVYTVSAKSSANTWKATYKVTVKGNRITALSDAYVTPLKGSVSNIRLKLETSTRGALHFDWKYLLSSSAHSVIATLNSSGLKVSVI